MNTLSKIVLSVTILGIFAVTVWSYQMRDMAAPASDRLEEANRVLMELDETVVYLEIAQTPEDRARGLSGRASLSEDQGMLFVFEETARHGFWMKDMNFPIDIIWIDQDFSVVDIKHEAVPDSFPNSFTPDSPALYVVEVYAGFAKKYGITEGQKIEFQKISER